MLRDRSIWSEPLPWQCNCFRNRWQFDCLSCLLDLRLIQLLFDGPDAKTNQRIVKQYPLNVPWCHVGCHVDFSTIRLPLAPQAIMAQCKVNLDGLWLIDQSHNLYITGQLPLS